MARLFIFVTVSLYRHWWSLFFKFNFLYTCCFLLLCQEIFSYHKVIKVFSHIFFSMFTALDFTFRYISLSNFCLYYRVKFNFITCVYAAGIDHFLKKNFLSPLNCFGLFCLKSIDHLCADLFLDYFVQLTSMFIVMQIPPNLD